MIDMLIGKQILNEFIVLEKIGAGSFATAYLAQQEYMDRLVVAKVTHPHLLEGTMASMVESRFQDEIKAASRVKHPNLITIYRAGYVFGCPTVVMEYVKGESVEYWLEQHAPLPEHIITPLFLQIASGLNALHKANIVHRDLSPNNVMLTKEDGSENEYKAVLLDFGIAQLDGNSKYTMGPLGTPRYMAPEQAQNQATTKSDVYSLGAMLWWALTGEVYLKEMNNFAEIFKFQLENPQGPDPRSIKPLIENNMADMIKRMLNANPDVRPSAEEFLSFWKAYTKKRPEQARTKTITRPLMYSKQTLEPNSSQKVVQKSLEDPGFQSFDNLKVSRALLTPEEKLENPVYLFNAGSAEHLLQQTQQAMNQSKLPKLNWIEVQDLWQIEAHGQQKSIPVLIFSKTSQSALISIDICDALENNAMVKPAVILAESPWSTQLKQTIKDPGFICPREFDALEAHLETFYPGAYQTNELPPNVIPLGIGREPSISFQQILTHQHSPEHTFASIDECLSQIPDLLAELESNLSNKQNIIDCCQRIEVVAKTLGMKQVTRLSQMIIGLAQHDMMDDLGGPYQDLEDAFSEGFQALLKFRHTHEKQYDANTKEQR